MKLLDLFCGAGGCAVGYSRAGFTEIVGVDIDPQPRYPFRFIQSDWESALHTIGKDFDAIHASPPCQFYSAGAKKWGTSENHPDLLATVRERLQAFDVPYVIENIEAAGPWMEDPVMLCGTYFGLGVFRHRLFESDGALLVPAHSKHTGRIGDGQYFTVTGHAGGSSKRDGWKGGSTEDWKRAMGIDWMVGRELAEAIPPAYTEFIGRQLAKSVSLAVGERIAA